MRTYEEVVDALSSGGWLATDNGTTFGARCPAHGGDDPNLKGKRSPDDGSTAIFACMSHGCAGGDILRAVGLGGGRGRKPNPLGRTEFEARLTADPTKRAATHVRVDDPKGKRIWWEPKGIHPNDLALYRAWSLPPGTGTVVVCEGERATEAIRAVGIDAVGTYGTGYTPSDVALKVLSGRDIVVWPDADDAGRRSMASLVDRIGPCRIVDTSTFPDKWDAADASPENICRIVADARDPRAVIRPQLADEPDLLAEFVRDLEAGGHVGERRVACLVFLAVVSRRQASPVSIAVKGPSASGKSITVERTLAFVRPSAYHALTAMSEHALAYTSTPLSHRMLVLYEYQGMSGETAAYLIRSLLSEGRIRYETVEKTSKGLVSRMIEKEGPTGLIVTTTAVAIHGENETRLFSVTVTDTPAQTSAIMIAQAEGRVGPDLTRWHLLDEWLDSFPGEVVVPYAADLAKLVPGVAVRMRRDFPRVLSLVRAHALLHAGTREHDAEGRVIATISDYAAVHDLVAKLFAEGVGKTVKVEMRATVEAVRSLTGGKSDRPTSGRAVAAALDLDKSAASRRIAVAIQLGFLRNLEARRGHPQQLVLDGPMPDDLAILPEAAAVARLHGSGEKTRELSVGVAPAPVGPLTPSNEHATVQPLGAQHGLEQEVRSGGDPDPDIPRATDRTTRPVIEAVPPADPAATDRFSYIVCSDFRAHQLDHRFVAGRWVCMVCAGAVIPTRTDPIPDPGTLGLRI